MYGIRERKLVGDGWGGAASTLPLMVVRAGYEVWKRRDRLSRPKEGLFVIEFVVHGEAHYRQAGQECTVRQGEAYVFIKNTDHEYATGNSNVLISRFVVLDGPLLDYLVAYGNLSGSPHCVPADAPRFRQNMRRAYALLSRNEPYWELQASHLAYQILLDLGLSAARRYHPVVDRCLELMGRNLHRRLPVSEVCQTIGVSRSHLDRLFAAHIGCSPGAYLIRQRMQWAAHLLRTSSLMVKEVGARVGYEDQLHFSSVFRRYMGTSPSAFRSRVMTAS